MSLIFATVPSKRLAQGITSSSSTFYLNNILGFDGLTNVASTDLGTQHYCVFRNDSGSRIEIMEIDPATISTGPITIVRRGLSFYGDRTTQTTALKLDWSANETIVQLGTDAPQIFQYLKEYIDAASIAGAVPASTTATGIVEEATQAEVDARTVTGGTGSKLFAPLDKIRASKYHDYAADAGSTDTYAITVTPAPTAYATGQIFAFKANTANTDACTLNVNSLGAKTIKKNGSSDLITGDIVASQLVMVIYDGTNFQLLSRNNAVVKFGGTGADGALAVSSGTTTIDLGGAAYVVKNYTSISITGTGNVAFSNPHANGTYVVFKSQGNVTITTSGSVSLVGIGANTATAGTVLVGTAPTATSNKVAGLAASGYGLTSFLYPKFIPFIIGGGGANASAGGAGVGGRGGGALYIECGGALNFTTGTITVAGTAGTVATSGGGGGGGGGSLVIVYNTLTANTGTVTKTGGAGGAGSNFDGGGGGGSTTAGVTGGTGSGVGGAGGDGFSLIAANTEFV